MSNVALDMQSLLASRRGNNNYPEANYTENNSAQPTINIMPSVPNQLASQLLIDGREYMGRIHVSKIIGSTTGNIFHTFQGPIQDAIQIRDILGANYGRYRFEFEETLKCYIWDHLPIEVNTQPTNINQIIPQSNNIDNNVLLQEYINLIKDKINHNQAVDDKSNNSAFAELKAENRELLKKFEELANREKENRIINEIKNLMESQKNEFNLRLEHHKEEISNLKGDFNNRALPTASSDANLQAQLAQAMITRLDAQQPKSVLSALKELQAVKEISGIFNPNVDTPSKWDKLADSLFGSAPALINMFSQKMEERKESKGNINVPTTNYYNPPNINYSTPAINSANPNLEQKIDQLVGIVKWQQEEIKKNNEEMQKLRNQIAEFEYDEDEDEEESEEVDGDEEYENEEDESIQPAEIITFSQPKESPFMQLDIPENIKSIAKMFPKDKLQDMTKSPEEIKDKLGDALKYFELIVSQVPDLKTMILDPNTSNEEWANFIESVFEIRPNLNLVDYVRKMIRAKETKQSIG